MATIVGKTLNHIINRLAFYGSYEECNKVQILSSGRRCQDGKITFNPDAKIVERIIKEIPSTKLVGDIERWYDREIQKQEVIEEALDKKDYFKSGLEFIINCGGRCIINDSPELPVEELISRYVNKWERVLVIVPEFKKEVWLNEIGMLRDDVEKVSKENCNDLIGRKEVVAVITFKQTENNEYIFLLKSSFDLIVVDGFEVIDDIKEPLLHLIRGISGYVHNVVLIDNRQVFEGEDFVKSLYYQLSIIDPQKYSSLNQFRKRISSMGEIDIGKMKEFLKHVVLQRDVNDFARYSQIKFIPSYVKLPKWLQEVVKENGKENEIFENNLATYPQGEGFESYEGFTRRVLDILRFITKYSRRTGIVVKNPKYLQYLTDVVRRVYPGILGLNNQFPDVIINEYLNKFNLQERGVLVTTPEIYEKANTNMDIFVDIDGTDMLKKEGIYINLCWRNQ